MGDQDAKVGEKHDSEMVSKYELGSYKKYVTKLRS